MTRTKPLFLIRNEPTDSMGIAPAAFERHGHALRIADAWERDVAWPEPRDVSGIVVFGGDQNADEVEGLPYLLAERDLLGRTVEERVPVLGVCLGAQLLARALGAAVRPSPVKEFGFPPLYPTDEGELDPVLSAIRRGDRIFQWHRDTFELPAGAALLTTGAKVRNQAYRAGELAWGVQFHPEVTAENIELWLSKSDPDELASEWGREPDQLRAEVELHLAAQHQRAEDLFSRFAEIASGNGPSGRV